MFLFYSGLNPLGETTRYREVLLFLLGVIELEKETHLSSRAYVVGRKWERQNPSKVDGLQKI
jgi:hypothetical protein